MWVMSGDCTLPNFFGRAAVAAEITQSKRPAILRRDGVTRERRMDAYWQEVLDRRWKRAAPRGKSPKFGRHSTGQFSAYQDRNRLLLKMGFGTYADYLESPLWDGIRQRVLERDGGLCWGCKKPATQVHHQQYTRNNLSGANLFSMVAVCGKCHSEAEMDMDRGKTPLWMANKRLGNSRKRNDVNLLFDENPEYKAARAERQSILELKAPTTEQIARCGQLHHKMRDLQLEADRRYKAQKKAARAARLESLDKDSRPSHGNTIPGSGGSGAVPTVQVASKTEPDSHPVAASRNHGEIVKPYPA
jgi:hypothetical protein